MKNLIMGVVFVALFNLLMVDMFGSQGIIVGLFLCLLIGWNNNTDPEKDELS